MAVLPTPVPNRARSRFSRFVIPGLWRLLFLAILPALRADDDDNKPRDKGTAQPDDSVYETDRPGEVENPFTVPPGHAEVVNYVVWANGSSREDQFGSGGASVFLDTAVRFGLGGQLEGGVTVDTFLHADTPDEGGSSRLGLGYATVLAKWNFLKSGDGDFGLAIAPFARLPLDQAIGGSSRVESGLIVPFHLEFGGGWESEGSSGVSRSPQADGGWSTQWQSQYSLERTLTEKLSAYAEIEIEVGEGRPAWITEYGFTARLSHTVLLDLGASIGVGGSFRGRMVYTGLGWSF